MARALAYMVPYIRDKLSWPLHADVMYDAEWPMRQSSLLLGGLALGHPEYVALWKTLPADSTIEEVVRNFFIRQPILWIPVSASAAKRPAPRRGVSGGEPTPNVRSSGVPPLR
jgi:hypothetical protein